METIKNKPLLETDFSFANWEHINVENVVAGLPERVADQLNKKLFGKPYDGKMNVEILAKTQKDGTKTYIKAETFIEEYRPNKHPVCSGVILDVAGQDVVGKTTFYGFLDDPYGAINVHDSVTKGDKYDSFTQAKTAENFQRKGLGERRLMIANAYCKERFDRFLRSDRELSDAARATWDKLVRKGFVKAETSEHNQNELLWYQFIK